MCGMVKTEGNTNRRKREWREKTGKEKA